MTWEEHIKERLEIGYFDTEDYVVLFKLEDKTVRICDVQMLACFPGGIHFTTSISEGKETTADEVKILHGNLPSLSQRLKPELLDKQMRIKFGRPL